MDSTTMCCPGCGGYRLAPGCANPDCPERWCIRAECGWSTGPCTHDQAGDNAWNLEHCDYPVVVNGVETEAQEKAQLRPLRWVGMDLADDDAELRFGHISTWKEVDTPEARACMPWTARNIALMVRTLSQILQVPTVKENDV